MSTLPPISRAEARARGLTRYFTGSPCLHGHVCQRMVSTGGCVECLRQSTRRSYARHTDQRRSAALARWRRAYDENPEPFRTRSRANYAADKEAWKDRVRAYVRDHPETARVTNLLSHRKGVPGTFTADDVIAKFEAQNGVCVCGADLTVAWQIDHIVPICRGGTHWPDNIQILCPPCNASKGRKTMAEWRGGKDGA
jgi:5-methylcytosine-specific restriction endonuclease McrA